MTVRKLKKLKQKAQLTNRQLAKVLGVAERTIYAWLSGEYQMQRWTVRLIDHLLRDYE